MWKPNKSRAEQHFAASHKKDDQVIKQKEKTQRERDERMARLRDLRLAKEAAEQQAAPEPAATETAAAEPAEKADTAEEAAARLPKVHPHSS
ncbi:MAG TPA: hypothetical protein VIS03_14720 [Kiloniellaceae bacterium]